MNLSNHSNHFKNYFILLLLIFVHQIESKRKNTGGRRTNTGSGHTTPRSNEGSSGNHHSTEASVHDTFHQTNAYQASNNNPLAPSAPNANPGIGFENINQRLGSQNNQQGIGFEGVQHRIPPQNNQPHSVGFNAPQQNNQPTLPGGFNVPPNGYQPQPGYTGIGGAQNPHFPQTNSYPGNNGINNQATGQFGVNNSPNLHLPHSGGYPGSGVFPGSGGYQPSGGYHNPNLAQPGSYYNSQFGVSNGVPPQIYQPVPVQQSSGSSLLGYAGSFAGGYLIGKLTSGGHDSSDQRYTVHHYHHNREEVPKQISVSNNSLVTCSQNDTQGLCVPNTFPICLMNGTILCVTHIPYTIPCGMNSSMSCIITVLPCVNGDLTCNNTANLTNTAVYVPCISNVTVAKPSELNSVVVPQFNTTSNQTIISKQVELCVTAIAEPKKMESPVVSYLELLAKIVELPLLDINTLSNSSSDGPASNSSNMIMNQTNMSVTN